MIDGGEDRKMNTKSTKAREPHILDGAWGLLKIFAIILALLCVGLFCMVRAHKDIKAKNKIWTQTITVERSTTGLYPTTGALGITLPYLQVTYSILTTDGVSIDVKDTKENSAYMKFIRPGDVLRVDCKEGERHILYIERIRQIIKKVGDNSEIG